MKTILVLVTSSPTDSANCHNALAFCKAACEMGIAIKVFFYGEGIHNANAFAQPVSDEKNIVQYWHSLVQEYKLLELIVCNTAANKRGIISEEESNDSLVFNLHTGFVAGGLAEFASLSQTADRTVQF